MLNENYLKTIYRTINRYLTKLFGSVEETLKECYTKNVMKRRKGIILCA